MIDGAGFLFQGSLCVRRLRLHLRTDQAQAPLCACLQRRSPCRARSALDLRSIAGRAYIATMAELRAQYGSSVDPRILRELTVLKGALDIASSEALCGKASGRRDVVRISNLIRRIEGELRHVAAQAAPAPATLADHLARLSAQRQAAPASPASDPPGRNDGANP